MAATPGMKARIRYLIGDGPYRSTPASITAYKRALHIDGKYNDEMVIMSHDRNEVRCVGTYNMDTGVMRQYTGCVGDWTEKHWDHSDACLTLYKGEN